jgi:hypothetical protein
MRVGVCVSWRLLESNEHRLGSVQHGKYSGVSRRLGEYEIRVRMPQ